MVPRLEAAWTAAAVALGQGLGQQASQPDLAQQSLVGPAPPDCPHPVRPGRVRKASKKGKDKSMALGVMMGASVPQMQPETGED